MYDPENPQRGCKLYITTDIREDDMVIAIMGRAGHGKTAFLNMLAESFGGDVERVTRYTANLKLDTSRKFTFYRLHSNHSVYQNKLVFLDTPGFDEDETNPRLADIINDTNGKMKESVTPKKLAGIIYLYNCSQGHNGVLGRGASEEPTTKNFKSMVDACEKGAGCITFATWNWDADDNGKPERQLDHEGEIDTFTETRKAITQGAQFNKFLGTATSARGIVDSLAPNTSTPEPVLRPHSPSLLSAIGNFFKQLCCCS
ncbi:hypothetical protein BJ165DRAFT_905107 [Panaeolus papilionaceus]|nr:hypothetical protein BJ165DRAFT_905107 [Panaeolus papilionaceus]